MAEQPFTTALPSTPNSLASGRYATKQSSLAADGDTSPWEEVFEEFSVFVDGGTTYTISVEMAFKEDKSDAFVLDSQDETMRGANYEFTGFAYVRLIRTAATGTAPLVTLAYRED